MIQMANWLLKEESTFGTSAFELMTASEGGAGDYDSDKSDRPTDAGAHTDSIDVHLKNIDQEKEFTILLNKVVILDNKKFFGSADVFFYSVIVNGLPDVKNQTPFWTKQLSFSNVKDGTVLPIDPTNGVLLFRGKPLGFLNLYLFAVRDIQTSRDFAAKLKENFVAKGIGNTAAALATIFSGPAAPITVPLARDTVTSVVDATLSYFEKQKNKVIGTYYGSLIQENSYGVGFHPPDFPPSLLSCGESMNLAYCVL